MASLKHHMYLLNVCLTPIPFRPVLVLYITESQQTKEANRAKLQEQLIAKDACIFVGKDTSSASVRKMSADENPLKRTLKMNEKECLIRKWTARKSLTSVP
jgi:type II secretory pathway component PulJ